ncbi:hypothetical protein ACFBZI_12050 [Moraxella sp. ZJ142]|uniref:hypothetical protein n=1 Tax=Moraxella marmotae TaxID=3344520 RepID=UPI0035D3ECC3
MTLEVFSTYKNGFSFCCNAESLAIKEPLPLVVSDDTGDLCTVYLDLKNSKYLRWAEVFSETFAEDEKFRQRIIKRCNKSKVVHTKIYLPATDDEKYERACKLEEDIERLIDLGDNARFSDYANLRSGHDEFSKMKTVEELEWHIDSLPCFVSLLKDEFEDEKDIVKVLRWLARGLPEDMAISKVRIDNMAADYARNRYKELEESRKNKPVESHDPNDWALPW